jgi:hypothetical protein
VETGEGDKVHGELPEVAVELYINVSSLLKVLKEMWH